MSFIFGSKKKISDNPPLQLNYYNDGSLYIPSSKQGEILKSIKQSKIKEIELLNYSINNLQTSFGFKEIEETLLKILRHKKSLFNQ